MKIALIVNTISKNKDVWEMFFQQLEKHTTPDLFANKYIFVDPLDNKPPEGFQHLFYDPSQVYKDQFVSCIQHIKEEYCIYISEDYILYDDVQENLIDKYRKVLDKNSHLSFIRFMRGGLANIDYPSFCGHDDLYQMYNDFPYFYTNQAALWRTRDLEKIHQMGPALHIGNKDWQNSFEYQATKTCQDLDIQGLYCHHGEPKRGLYHYDSTVFPHISTALVKGKWNVTEYPKEMSVMIKEYGIDIKTRGYV